LKDFPSINPLAGLERVDALEQLRFEFFRRSRHSRQTLLLIFSEPPQTGANDLTRSLVQTTADFLLHKAFQFWRE
jgi:hypothetical protein